MTEFFYRIEESRYTEEDGHKDIFIRAFPVIKTTPCGVWLNTGKWELNNESVPRLVKARNHKFVLRKNGKFAQPTQELALAAFIRRKTIHIAMSQFRLGVLEGVLMQAQKPNFKPVNVDKVNELVAAWEKSDEPART